MGFAGAMVVAMAMDALLGWPAPLFARIGHPVTWLGRLIAVIDTAWNRASDPPWFRRAAGVAGALLVIAVSVALGWMLQSMVSLGWIQIVLVGVLAWPLVALRSLHDHVAAVAKPLKAGDIAAAREAVSRIVGRDPAALDEAGIARAAIESLAENASDGIVAPVFWGALFGLPGIFGYKAINTLDSMIGHRSDRHQAFGWAAARIDDVLNLVPARLTALSYALLGATAQALRCWRMQAAAWSSPNAGPVMAAGAGAVGVALGGGARYHGEWEERPPLGTGDAPRAAHVRACLRLVQRTLWLWLGVAMLSVPLVSMASSVWPA